LSYAPVPRKKLSFSLGKYMTVFQDEVYAIRACRVQNSAKGYRNRNLCILLDSEAALPLAEHNRVELIWLLDHRGIESNETAK
jgi:hypothetical protein